MRERIPFSGHMRVKAPEHTYFLWIPSRSGKGNTSVSCCSRSICSAGTAITGRGYDLRCRFMCALSQRPVSCRHQDFRIHQVSEPTSHALHFCGKMDDHQSRAPTRRMPGRKKLTSPPPRALQIETKGLHGRRQRSYRPWRLQMYPQGGFSSGPRAADPRGPTHSLL